MDNGKPVSITLTDEKGDDSEYLYCELIQKARFGESFIIKSQRCKIAEFVFRNTEKAPIDYYFDSKRYIDRNTAKKAVENLSRFDKKPKSIKISPYHNGYFDVLILFIKPKNAMKLIQAYAYKNGKGFKIKSNGTASLCSETTAYPITSSSINLSMGCRGSRKHSKYSDNEVVVGLSYDVLPEIEKGLEIIG